MPTNELLSKPIEQLVDELEEILNRLRMHNEMPATRSRNLSLAVTNLENTLDKLYRVGLGE